MAITNASTLAEFGSGIGTIGAVLQVDNDNKRVGIGTTNPQAMLQVGTGVTVFGNAGIASFTSLKLSGETDSTSTTTGALTVTGGVGIGLSLTVGGDVSVGGTITYEDVTNVDSIGIVTARSGLRVVGGGVTCVGVATFFSNIDANGALDVDGHTELDDVNVSGASTFAGAVYIKNTFPRLYLLDTDSNSDFSVINSNGSFMIYDDSNSASRFTINSSGVGAFNSDLEVAGSQYITDSIIHTGDTNTKIRFPAADTFTVETAGTERLRIADDGELTSTATQADVATFTSNQSASTIYVKDSDGDGIFISGSSAYGHRVYTNTTEDLLLGTNSVEILRIATGGYVRITSVDAGATGPTLKLFHNSASPADNDIVSVISMCGDDDAGNETEFSSIYTKVTDVSNNSETGHIAFKTRALSSYNEIFRLAARSSASAPSYTTDDINGIILDVYNTGNPYPRYMNFIAKSGGDTDTNISLWTEAVGGSPTEKLRIAANGQVRLNTAGAPAADLHVGGTGAALNAYFQTSRTSGAYHNYAIGNSGASLGYIGSAGQISASGGATGFAFRSEADLQFCSGGSTERLRINSGGSVNIGADFTQTTRKLSVSSSTEQVATFEYTGNAHDGCEVRFFNNSSSPAVDDVLGYLQFAGKNSAGEDTLYSAITSHSRDVTDGTENGSMSFYTRKNGSWAVNLDIMESGDVEICRANTRQIIGGFGAVSTGGTTDWNDATNARAGNGYSLLLGSATNGPGGNVYYHVFTYEYNSNNGTGNMTQMGYPYNAASIVMRTRYSGTWNSWVSVALT